MVVWCIENSCCHGYSLHTIDEFGWLHGIMDIRPRTVTSCQRRTPHVTLYHRAGRLWPQREMHARAILANPERFALSAVCDLETGRLMPFAAQFEHRQNLYRCRDHVGE